ncbi:hypothetical protein [Kribbella sp. VKM Ac-2568]|uniref:hypothetical protein n=1 Tax=Kribbella sp. VKM Ac-2568 TaxID=2512219 RepID=UPI0013050D2C|nr:hypothetical protein [Kribbella sp. VKM Ac-2568]
MEASLLAHVVSKFSARQWENVATESLRFLLAGGAGEAPARVVRPFVEVPAGLRWHAQAVADDGTGIPDLVGDDAQRRPVVIIEGKFWAALTRHQPTSYLRRQAEAFVDHSASDAGDRAAPTHSHVLIFLVPAQRQALVARELEERMGCVSTYDPTTGLTALDNGQLVVVVSWARMLAEVRSCLQEADDRVGLDNLAQLVGLCNRADREAMLPFTTEDIDTASARRLLDFYDLVDRVTDELVRRGTTSTSGLKTTSTKGHYGRYQKHLSSGVEVQVNLSTWWWAHRYPTPLWLRLWKHDHDVLEAWRDLADTGRLAHVEGPEEDGFARVALRIPLGVEPDLAVTNLADQVEVALSALTGRVPAEPVLPELVDDAESDVPTLAAP